MRGRLAVECLESRQLLAADLAITEFVASNSTGLRDGDGDSEDWIELHNMGSDTVSLDGWSLTDTPDRPYKWSLPPLQLDADAYLIVFASGKDRAYDSIRLIRDFHSTPDGTFLVDVPDGEYDVRLTLGDAEKIRDEVAIYVQGERVDTVTTAPGEFESRQYRAVVGESTGGQLAIRLRDMGGETGRAALGALAITPAGDGDPLRFDFGTPESLTEPGFLSVAVGNTYSAELGYGWQSGTVVAAKDRVLDRDEPHTNFKLSAGGDYLALVSPEGIVVSEFGDNGTNYPEQRSDVSFGVTSDGPRYLSPPTPGSANGDGFLGWVTDTAFSVNRGFYDQPQIVRMTTETPSGTIYYTTDGSVPDPDNASATLYTAPVTIGSTTVLRALAFRPGYLPVPVETESYFFIDDVIRQDFQQTVDAGFPEMWGRIVPDYGMDPDVIGQEGQDLFGGVYSATIRDDLLSIPTLSIVMNVDDMFGPNGIYTQSDKSGEAWERPTSVELLRPDGVDGFQIDAGIRIQGGAFRSSGLTKKNSLRLVFKDKYGDGKLRYPFFGEDAAQQFDTITLRMESNDGWQWAAAGGQPQYARDEFLRRTQLAMGQPAPHGNRVHLYINGIYWGMYNPVERPDQSFGAAYFGADKEAWDGINSGDPPALRNAVNADGDRDRQRRTFEAWRTMIGLTADVAGATTESDRTAALQRLEGNFPDGTDDPSREDFLDVDNMIDYMIVNLYGGNTDWPQKNFYVGRENDPQSTGFKFFNWDAEWSLFLRNDVNSNRLGSGSGVAAPFQNLRASEEFRLRFGDHVQRHFFNGGALYVDAEHPEWDPDHPESNIPAARYIETTEELFDGLVAESARWGDQHRERPYTRDVEWRAEFERLLTSWFPQRSAIVVDQFRQAGLYPNFDPPRFNQHGGQVDRSFELEITAPEEGAIYYTVDGSDPRAQGGGVSASAIPYDGGFRLIESAPVKARLLLNDQWSALNEAAFIVMSDLPLRITEMNVNPHQANPVSGLGERDVDNDRFEFVELMNVGDEPIDLAGVSLTETDRDGDRQGIAFTFGPQTLAPGERTVVVRDRSAFESRYGTARSLAIGDDGMGGPPGQYGGKLANGGERITLLDAGGAMLH
ncbi:MAG: chitobiase/beta-hexosaminidase C-terminal domain-containing protein, partial [Pirellulales bacterium]